MGHFRRHLTVSCALACGVAMMLIGPAATLADAPPAVTGAASAVSATSAALNGTISPGGLDTYWTFQWGTSTAYGNNTTPATTPLTGTGSFAVMAPLTGLQPGTTYHFRLVAVQGAAGASGQPTLSGGADMSFTTPTSNSTTPGGRHSRASLRSRRLAVRNGAALIPWRCSGTSGAVCRGTISLSARGRVAGKVKTVSCGRGTLSVSTGGQRTVRVPLGKQCMSLVKRTRHHQLRASLKASFSVGTGNLKTPVTLVS